MLLGRGAVPKTPSGKIQRYRCRLMLDTGQFAPIEIVELWRGLTVWPRTVLITGASGVVGRAVAAELRDCRVIGLVHSDPDVPGIAEVLSGDLAQPWLGLVGGGGSNSPLRSTGRPLRER